ncbi:type II toxin-antitoxin system CcdA family antitoxin [Streptomyces sp. NPDC054884]|uniref:type II toxin-antitoxin system CcdA family antitoxin n=1 Tax=Streptomyces sp. ME08-AFT2 TaxID=3028683 RepID=UPI0029A7E6C2|nr:type II toxin-antitoxin system CcdA family antitoxin [Streptomyces sp. ME08-AFT2]MDX3311111.1 type II toxin-antitoxin system CcdA family antitoxin [Streptomyces sp. ME08-AFT2]
MASKKITITVPEELVEAARELTDNVSGYIAEAFARKIRNDLLAEEVRRYEESHGAFTDEERAEADALLHRDQLPGERAA